MPTQPQWGFRVSSLTRAAAGKRVWGFGAFFPIPMGATGLADCSEPFAETGSDVDQKGAGLMKFQRSRPRQSMKNNVGPEGALILTDEGLVEV